MVSKLYRAGLSSIWEFKAGFEKFLVKIVFLLQLQNGKFNSLDTKNPHTLQLSGLDGIYVNSIGQQESIQSHHGQGGRTKEDLEKLKYLNKLDESCGFMCIHISK